MGTVWEAQRSEHGIVRIVSVAVYSMILPSKHDS